MEEDEGHLGSSGIRGQPQERGFESGPYSPLRKRFMVSLLASFMAVCPE